MFYFYDPTYMLVIVGLLLCLFASSNVKRTYAKYSRVKVKSNITGAEMAERILHNSGIRDVKINHIAGNMTDNYNPKNKTLNLSDSTYNSSSISAIGIAAHECGHAIQHAKSYSMLMLRGAIVPVVNIGARIAWPLIIIGFITRSNSSNLLIKIGILAFALSVIFSLITLPVEFNASNRACKILSEDFSITNEETSYARKVLNAAALTYVAAALNSILSLLRIVLLTRNRD